MSGNTQKSPQFFDLDGAIPSAEQGPSHECRSGLNRSLDNFWGLNIPLQYGGQGVGLAAILATIRLLSRSGLIAPAILSSHMRAATYLVQAGTEHQRLTLLPRLARGDLVAAHAYSERVGPASPPPVTLIERDGSGYFLRGTKHWVTNAAECDLLIVIARHPERDALSAVMIPRDRFGSITLRHLERPGMQEVSLCEVIFSELRLDLERDLVGGSLADVRQIVEGSTPAKYLNFAARAVGAVEALEGAVRDVLKKRAQPPHPVALHRYGAIRAEVFAARAAFEQVIQSLTSHHLVIEEAMAARLFCTRSLTKVIEEYTNLLGGSGYGAPSNPMSRILRDASSLVVAGTPLDRLQVTLGANSL